MTAQVWAALLGGAAVGALLTALATLLGGWLTRRHENRRWLLDKRFELYFAFNSAVHPWTGGDSSKVTRDRVIDLLETVIEQEDRLRLVASDETVVAARRVVDAIFEVSQNGDEAGRDLRDTEALHELGMKPASKAGDLMTLQRRDLQGARAWWRRRKLPTLRRSAATRPDS